MLNDQFSWGIEIILYLQEALKATFPIWQGFTFLGVTEFYLLVMPIVLWAVNYHYGFRLGAIILLNGGVLEILKTGFHSPRPYWVDPRVQGIGKAEVNFGMPSGHSMIPMVAYGLLAADLKRRWVTVLAVFVIVMMGLSRVVLGMHLPLDVLVGWTFGIISLYAFLRLEKPVRGWFAKQTLGGKITAMLVITVGLVLINAVVIFALADFEVPAVWVENALKSFPGEEIEPISLNAVITSVAALFGLTSGYFWLTSKGGFSVQGPVWQRIVRVVVGILGVVILWQGLGAVFPRNHDLLGYSLRFVRYALIGGWVSGLGPWLFTKIKLADPEK